MKVNCNRDGTFKGHIPDIKTYDEVKNGTKDWKPHIKPKLKSVEIPFELFEYFVDLDREFDKRVDNNLQAEIEKLKKSRDRWKKLAKDFDRFTREEEMMGDK